MCKYKCMYMYVGTTFLRLGNLIACFFFARVISKAHMDSNACVCVYACMCMCMYVCMYVFMCMCKCLLTCALLLIKNIGHIIPLHTQMKMSKTTRPYSIHFPTNMRYFGMVSHMLGGKLMPKKKGLHQLVVKMTQKVQMQTRPQKLYLDFIPIQFSIAWVQEKVSFLVSILGKRGAKDQEANSDT